MTTRFIIEVTDDTTADDIKEALYEASIVSTSEPYGIKETHRKANGEPRMTTKQRDRLWEMCGNYNVPFREDDYHEDKAWKNGFYEGWVGGAPGTIYTGVAPDGRSHT